MVKKITICFCTFRRPDGLRDLFSSLEALNPPHDIELDICVVDNDETPSSQALVSQLGAGLPWPVNYFHEAEAGIPFARNRALSESATSDYAAFIDDDETVSPEWLTELWRIACLSGAHFVQGPVEKRVEHPEDDWWLRSIFFREKVAEDGADRWESWTNNVLIDLAFTSRHGIRFDERLRFDGGEDTLFFQDVVRHGGRGSYAAKALVYEVQHKDRLNWSWALMRQYRYGVTRANTALLRMPRWRASLYCLIRGSGMIAVGCGYLATTLFRGKLGLADGSGLIWRGAGVYMGGLGARRWEYAR